ncbi:integrase core domain-containing protein [Burkholderia stagnalis]|uniref:integrase core domain-containing protein n=1 Tax=Burkholderia stagnalis TaxID=1503054 RepID=UPI0035DEDB7B
MAGRLTTRLQRPAAPRVDGARAKISAWRTHQNESRPHSALDCATPHRIRPPIQPAGHIGDPSGDRGSGPIRLGWHTVKAAWSANACRQG